MNSTEPGAGLINPLFLFYRVGRRGEGGGEEGEQRRGRGGGEGEEGKKGEGGEGRRDQSTAWMCMLEIIAKQHTHTHTHIRARTIKYSPCEESWLL